MSCDGLMSLHSSELRCELPYILLYFWENELDRCTDLLQTESHWSRLHRWPDGPWCAVKNCSQGFQRKHVDWTPSEDRDFSLDLVRSEQILSPTVDPWTTKQLWWQPALCVHNSCWILEWLYLSWQISIYLLWWVVWNVT